MRKQLKNPQSSKDYRQNIIPPYANSRFPSFFFQNSIKTPSLLITAYVADLGNLLVLHLDRALTAGTKTDLKRSM